MACSSPSIVGNLARGQVDSGKQVRVARRWQKTADHRWTRRYPVHGVGNAILSSSGSLIVHRELGVQ
jgi:hypothetical protein